MHNFLPEDYESPKSSSWYLKLQEGENKIRILSQPVYGWEDWKDNKPIRFKMEDKPRSSVDPKKPVRHFWAFIVWNYDQEQIQIMHITQATVRSAIEALCKDKDWGAPFFYDIKIIKKGEGTKTEYLVNPLPHKPLPDYVEENFKLRPCNLDALFQNEDPFAKHWDKQTPGIFRKEDAKNQERAIPDPKFIGDRAGEIEEILKHCDQKYLDDLKKCMADLKPPVTKICDLPLNMYESLRKSAFANKQQNVQKQAEGSTLWVVK